MSLTAEQEVIAALLMNPYLAKECDLSPDEFRMELYQDIYRAILVQCDESGAFDVVTLGDHFSQTLPEQQAKHMFESMCGLAENAVGSKSMFPKYCEIIRKDNRLRQIEAIATSLKYEITENKNIDAADKAIADLMALDRTGRNYLWTLEDSVKAGLRQIEEAAEREGLVGIDTGGSARMPSQIACRASKLPTPSGATISASTTPAEKTSIPVRQACDSSLI